MKKIMISLMMVVAATTTSFAKSNNTYYPPRKTPKECYEQIIADLTDAEQYAPDNDNSDRTNQYFLSTFGAVRFLHRIIAANTAATRFRKKLFSTDGRSPARRTLTFIQAKKNADRMIIIIPFM